jgi:hypothetical protein
MEDIYAILYESKLEKICLPDDAYLSLKNPNKKLKREHGANEFGISLKKFLKKSGIRSKAISKTNIVDFHGKSIKVLSSQSNMIANICAVVLKDCPTHLLVCSEKKNIKILKRGLIIQDQDSNLLTIYD